MALFNNPKKYFNTIKKSEEIGGEEVFWSVLVKSFPELTNEELSVSCKRLYHMDLTNTERVTNLSVNLDSNSSGRLTEAGKKFIKYCSDYKSIKNN
jgi:hypothetical protein